MASFTRALAGLLKIEGGYVNDPDDLGGETYRGIARRYNADWSGWARIDQAKRGRGFPASLERDTALRTAVRQFYKQRYWDPYQGTAIADQAIAAKLLDIAVNLGVARAVTFLQRALNVLNRDGALYPDLQADGAFGPQTQTALTTYRKKDKPVFLLKTLNILQGMHYIESIESDATREKYARGWLKRVG